MVLWDWYSSYLSMQQQQHAASMVPLLVVVTLFILITTIWTWSCGVIFVKDVYAVLVYPYVVRPAIAGASQYSLDQVLSILCDPTQLAAYISAIIVVPVTLYTLPTTPQQRAQILLSTFRPSPNNPNDDGGDDDTNQKIFTEAGAWKYLLPKSIQKVVDDSNNDVSIESQKHSRLGNLTQQLHESVMVDELYHDVGRAVTTEDEDESNDDASVMEPNTTLSSPPKYRSRALEEPIHPSGSRHKSKRLSPPSAAAAAAAKSGRTETCQEMNTWNLFYQIVTDLWKEQCHSMIRQGFVPDPSTLRLTAVTCGIILALQFRTSSTARFLLRSGMHMALTTTCSVTLVGALGALLLWAPLDSPDDRVQSPPHDSKRTLRTDALLLLHRWSTILVSVLRSNVVRIMSSSIPISMPTPIRKKDIQQFLSKWKGTLALFLLTYFQYRYRKITSPRRDPT